MAARKGVKLKLGCEALVEGDRIEEAASAVVVTSIVEAAIFADMRCRISLRDYSWLVVGKISKEEHGFLDIEVAKDSAYITSFYIDQFIQVSIRASSVSTPEPL